MKPLLVRIPPELHARVKEESVKTGKSMSLITIEALQLHLDSETLDVQRKGEAFTVRLSKDAYRRLEE